MSYQYPPAAPTLSGDVESVNRFLNDSPVVARQMASIAAQRFVSQSVLTQRVTTTSGAASIQGNEGLYADRAATVISPGAEYPLTTVATGPVSMVNTQKWGQDHLITDEAISRQNFQVVRNGMTKLVNTAVKQVDGVSLSLIASSVTQTYGTAGTNNWTSGTAKILSDILNAKATIYGLNLGFEPDALLVNDATWAAIASDPTLQAAMARENANNPVYTGQLTSIAGVTILPTPNLPANGAWLLDTSVFGGFVIERLGGDYDVAGDFLETKSIRVEEKDGFRLRARAVYAPFVQEPNAAIKIANGQ